MLALQRKVNSMLEKVYTEPIKISNDFREIPSLLDYLGDDVRINKIEYDLTNNQKSVLIKTARQTVKVHAGDIVQVADGSLLFCFKGGD